MEYPQKKCSKCKQMKLTQQFSFCKSHKDGYCNYCKQCDSAKSIKYNENNKELIAGKYKIYREANKEKINLQKREKLICECGCEINKNGKARHLKSKIHTQLIQNINNNPLDV